MNKTIFSNLASINVKLLRLEPGNEPTAQSLCPEWLAYRGEYDWDTFQFYFRAEVAAACLAAETARASYLTQRAAFYRAFDKRNKLVKQLGFMPSDLEIAIALS
jgi:hypothetical protein